MLIFVLSSIGMQGLGMQGHNLEKHFLPCQDYNTMIIITIIMLLINYMYVPFYL